MSAAAARRDRGSVAIPMLLLVVVVLGGAGLVVDGGRAMAARRHAANVAEGAARAGASTVSPAAGLDPGRAAAAALDHAVRSGVPAGDVRVTVAGDTVTVTVTERRRTVFLVLGGQSTLTVHATGSAVITPST